MRRLIEVAADRGVELRFPPAEVEKHGLEERAGSVLGADPDGDTDLAIVFGGDGTILTALRACAVNRAPVFAFNYGAIGFLSTVDRDQLEEGLARALDGDFEVLAMPALAIEVDGSRRIGVNDISFQRRANSRVARLEYAVEGGAAGTRALRRAGGRDAGRLDGLQPRQRGPVLAWGVEGFVVSFIAPHTLTARALVVAPGDALVVGNTSEREGSTSRPTAAPSASSVPPRA